LREAGSQPRGTARLTFAIAIGIMLPLLPAAVRAQAIPGAQAESTQALARGEWPAYGGTYASARYSPLAQIDRTNAKDLHIAWRWKSPDMAIKEAKPSVGPSFANESTPLMIGGTLYTSTSLSQVAAIDAATGETKWVFDPKIYENGLGIPANLGWLNRGIAYWRNGDDERVMILTAFAQMIALDARNGKPVPTFGTDGRIDLAEGLRRPVDRDYYTMTGDRPRSDRGGFVGDGLVGTPAAAARRYQRLRRRHRTSALDLSHRCTGGRTRRRDLGEGVMEGSRECQRLGADERRRGAWLRLLASEYADQRLLWRPSSRRRPLWRQPGLR
jgi:glucose dehydrogenase